MSKTLVLANQNILKIRFDQVPKTPPFSHNQISPPQESDFCNKRVLIKNQVFLHFKFLKNSQVVADPVALALISPPLALSTKIEELLGPLTPLPHKNVK